VPIVKFLLGISKVSVPWDTLILSVVLFVVIPLTGGILTRMLITRRKGLEYFEKRFLPKFDNATTLGLLLTLILLFAFQGEVFLNNPLHIILIAIPLTIQTFIIFFISYIPCKWLKLPHNIAAPAGMIGASNFFELSVAVAIALFGTTSPAALATTVGVLTEVPVMLILVKIANKTKHWFPDTTIEVSKELIDNHLVNSDLINNEILEETIDYEASNEVVTDNLVNTELSVTETPNNNI
jgi:ACR3 family arsenite transporter